MADIKILVVADSHGNTENVRKAVEKESPFDILVHCGDIEGTLDSLTAMGDFKVVAVRGNCDSDLNLNPTEIFKAGFYTIWVTHGHNHNVKYENELSTLCAAAGKNHADIVLFGHSHYAECQERDGILMLNPGTIAGSRFGSESPTYATLLLTDDYERIPEIKPL